MTRPAKRSACEKRLLACALLASALCSGVAGADEPEAPVLEAVVSGTAEPGDLPDDRATSTVRRKEMDKRLPRSAPDALRYEPGVFVQQSGHGQGSAFLRGLTGQQTLLLFDGVRMNNSTYRQGPNQYFFTLDAKTIRSIEVERGGASTRFGSDALGGVIDAHPLEPLVPGSEGAAATSFEPRLSLRGATADEERGGRFQLTASRRLEGGGSLAFLGGFGGREVGLLHGPAVLNPNASTDAGPLPWVPRYAEYDPTQPIGPQISKLRTQLGTGFEELSGDARVVLRGAGGEQLTIAAYGYREYNAPRTDQCPPPTAPYDQCLVYEQQFRHLVYAAWEPAPGGPLLRPRVTLSWQQQHEQRRQDLTAANQVRRGYDTVDTFGLTARAGKGPLLLAEGLPLELEFGADQYFDALRSRAEHTYTDTLDSVAESRGQYLDGSWYLTGGAFADARLPLGERFTVRAGARLSWAAAHAPGDPQSGSAKVDRAWVPLAGHAGAEALVAAPLRLFVNYDRSFRAPNLDDLSSRQQTGPGFQFENPALGPEVANTFEVGARLRTPRLVADGWLFETVLQHAIFKVPRGTADCPPNTPQCSSSWSRFQLQNAPSYSELRGAEGALALTLPQGLSLRATAAFVWSEGPRLGNLTYGVNGVTLGERVPLSRTPPLNGTVELGWQHASGLSAGAALQWAALQDRLAIADYADGRIPKYGTPGFAVVHLRASYRLGSALLVSAALENLFDAPYRFHGSSVNGAGRGLLVHLEAARWL